MDKRSYKDLVVWQRAIAFVPLVHALIKRFPEEERFALGDQLRRAVVSVPANIAEGQGRQHRKEFLQYLAIARGSLAEVHTLLVVAHRLNYMGQERLEALEWALAEIARPLHGLMAAVSESPPRTTNQQPRTPRIS